MYQSVATIDSPEFLNLQPLDINPLMSKCEIKVFYIGVNRNNTYINEQVATEIGKTLRGAPIVGYYKENKEDFADHGEKIIIDDEGIKFQCQTIPYGFVSPDADVWFQNFEDKDLMGNTVIHKYLMTTGYLWTDQFPESSLPVKEGRPQSMELKGDSIEGKWQTNYETGVDFFIINDAIIQKICILGEDVEPCFEGASVTSPNVSSNFTLDDNFKHTLYSMMQDLKNALEGGQQMENLETTATIEEEQVETNFVLNQDETVVEDSAVINDPEDASIPSDYVKDEEKKEEEESSNSEEEEESSNSEEDVEEKEKEEDDEENKKKYALLEEELNEIKNSYQILETQYQELVKFKQEIDNQKKDELISEFYMLSEEDKADVVQNKEKYTLDEIKAKLAVICFDKKINFSLDTEEEQEQEDPAVIYSLDCENNSFLPDWVKAVKEQEKNM